MKKPNDSDRYICLDCEKYEDLTEYIFTFKTFSDIQDEWAKGSVRRIPYCYICQQPINCHKPNIYDAVQYVENGLLNPEHFEAVYGISFEDAKKEIDIDEAWDDIIE